MLKPFSMSSVPISPSSLFQRVWRPALLILGLGVTVVWTVFLGYEFIDLIAMSL